MRGSAWRLAAVLIGSVGVIASPSSGQVPLRLPDSRRDQKPSVSAAPPQTDPQQALNQQLKETQDRLHDYEVENVVLRRRNELTEETIRILNQSLAVSNAEGETIKRGFADQSLRMEALGLASVGDNKEALEQRLLKAVRDLSLVRDEKEKLVERMMALCETVVLYIKAAPVADPQLRLDIETQMRAANEAMDVSSARETATSFSAVGELGNGQVISLKEEYSLIVANLGSQQGVKIGMPFQVVRGSHLVARARVVDVRERISGAVIEGYSSNTEKVKVGDGLRVEAQQ